MNRIRKGLRDSLRIIRSDGSDAVVAEFSLPPDFAGFQGHFTGSPILPGVCMMDAVVIAAEEALDGRRLKIREIKTAKFFSPVTPGMAVGMQVALAQANGGYYLKATLNSGERKIAGISLYVE